MPEISRFLGISITMYFKDHAPPHFHAEYNGIEILVDINSNNVIKGVFPSNKLKLILAWAEIHHEELLSCWELAKNNKMPTKIEPLH